MILFLTLLAVYENIDPKSVEVRFTESAPLVDGIIEEIWQTADSAYDFIQHAPYEKVKPTERTVVYILQDGKNLYLALRCYAEKHKPIACLTKEGDNVVVKFDPFGSKTTGYYFRVCANGLFYDGWILDDGRTEDDSWDGVWYRAVRLHKGRYEVEVKIPFKSIRYKKGLSKWGIQFERYIAANEETDYWTEIGQREEDLVSKWNNMNNVMPQATGYYFELYPETYLRYDRKTYYGDDSLETDSTEIKPRASLNFKWDITPQITLNATVLPDFAQIESDPFKLNLDRYPVYLEERRPFFLEGKDVFRMFDFGEGKGFFDPLEIFYSRKIGKSINGDAIPILGGLQMTSKSESWNIGALGAYTDQYINESNSIDEPHRWFSAIRAKHRILGNSDIGTLLAGTIVDKDDYNYAIGIDGAYRSGSNQFIAQGALSARPETTGLAFRSGYFGFAGKFLTVGSAEAIGKSFNVDDIGFVPWSGRKKLLLFSGPYWTYPKGFARSFFLLPGIVIIQEPGDDNYSKIIGAEINSNFRNSWGFDFSVLSGPYYEMDTTYLYRGLDLSIWGKIFDNWFNFWCGYSYTYNYSRGFLAYQASNNVTYDYSIIPQMSIGIEANLWIEWDDQNNLHEMTPRIKPMIDFKFNADMSLSVFSELIMITPGTSFSQTELYSNRFGMLFSWNFMPKSWFYFAINDYHEQDDFGKLKPEYTIGAIKAKYLIYF